MSSSCKILEKRMFDRKEGLSKFLTAGFILILVSG